MARKYIAHSAHSVSLLPVFPLIWHFSHSIFRDVKAKLMENINSINAYKETMNKVMGC